MFSLTNTTCQYHGTPTAYRQRWHREHPRSHHILYPSLHCCRTPLVLHRQRNLPPTGGLRDYMLQCDEREMRQISSINLYVTSTRGGRWLAYNSSIFTMVTVVSGERLAVSESCFSTNTVHIIINNCSSALAK